MTAAATGVATAPSHAREDEGRSSSARRARLIERFDALRPRFLSLDVFDTLLARPFEKPTDLFVELHRALGARGQVLGVDARTFATMRIEAEAVARRAQPGSEVTISEIATELSRALDGRISAETLIDVEFETERAFIHLDHDVAALIRHAAQRGVPYFLVSDMYLQSSQILELIHAACAAEHVELPEPLHIFVSGEHRANKVGNMFAVILRELGCKPTQIFHVGDHPVADVSSPRKHGIHSEHVFRETKVLSEILDAETRYHSHGAPGHHYDVGLRTTRLKAVTSSMAHDAIELDHFRYGAFVLGPLLTAFAEWIVDDCVRHGQDRVYCLMREGHLLAPLIEMAARAVDVKLEVRKLWASRYALRAASFREVSEREMQLAFYKRRNATLESAARDLGLDLALVRELTGITHDERLHQTEVDRVIYAILGSEDLRKQVLMSSAERRRRLFDHYREEGVFDRDRLTIVDLGWGGTMQRRLAVAFEELPRPKHIRALYFATHGQLFELPRRTCSADSFLFHLGQPQDKWLVLQRTPEVLENACMPYQGSFRGIDESGAPTFFPQVVPERQLREIEEIQRGIMRFAELWLPGSKRRRAQLTHFDDYVFLARLRSILVRSLEAPTLAEVRLFDDWGHDANDGALDHENLIGSPEMRERARHMTYEEIMQLHTLDSFWPGALARWADKSPSVNVEPPAPAPPIAEPPPPRPSIVSPAPQPAAENPPPPPVAETVSALIARSATAISRFLRRR